MELIGLCFTQKGREVLCLVKEHLKEKGEDIECYSLPKYADDKKIFPIHKPLQEFVGQRFTKGKGFVFVGAAGIAVRTIAPYLVSKTEDPPVVVVDELGKYVISLLSGHLGGANDLAQSIAHMLHAVPVITTATDLNEQFAVDIFAKKNDLIISNMTTAKEISAEVLHGGTIGLSSELPVFGEYPACFAEEYEEITEKVNDEITEKVNDKINEKVSDDLTKKVNEVGNKKANELGIYIGILTDKKPFPKTLHLIPHIVTVGIGCKRGTPLDVIEERIAEVLEKEAIAFDAIEQIVSIDIKKEEQGLLEYVDKYQLPFQTFSKEELLSVEGNFSHSDFVESVAGVGNVCERAAIFATNGKLFHKKDAKNGVTIALAMKDRRINFE